MVQVHNHKTGEAIELEQNQRQLHRTEAEARVAGIQMLLGWNEDGVLNGSAERRHYAHGDTNACGTPLEDGRAGRNEPISCLDCLGALGFLSVPWIETKRGERYAGDWVPGGFRTDREPLIALDDIVDSNLGTQRTSCQLCIAFSSTAEPLSHRGAVA